jgi:hypothetical protein
LENDVNIFFSLENERTKFRMDFFIKKTMKRYDSTESFQKDEKTHGYAVQCAAIGRLSLTWN